MELKFLSFIKIDEVLSYFPFQGDYSRFHL